MSRLFLLCLLASTAMTAAAQPLTRAHAHNDYEHKRPLYDALDHGFTSVEADIHLVDGELLVAHNLEDVVAGQTLQALYLDPLRARGRQNGGRVYAGGPVVTLLIDIKSDGEATYRVLHEVLRGYADILTIFTPAAVEEGAVTAIISGNRPRAMMEAAPIRFAAYDGRLEDLTAPVPAPAAFMPLVSSNWSAIARWYGQGALPEAARQRLREAVALAHAQGRKIRFWATTDNPVVWQVLYDAGVDFLNADDLPGLQAFLLEQAEKGAEERKGAGH